jgi:hypothetical protein
MSQGSPVVSTIVRAAARCSLYLLTLLSVTSLIAIPSFAEGKNWPREISVPEAEIVIYQPQLESFSGDKLSSRAALSVTVKDATELVFGAAWFDCRVETDREARTVDLVDIKVSAVKFPDAREEHLEKLTAILEREIPIQELTIDLDELLAALDLVEREQAAAEDLGTTSPEIIFTTGPAVLVVIDGDPELRAIEETDLMRVINTPFLTLLDSPTKSYFLRGGDLWFRAAEIKGDWSLESDPPQSVTAYATRLDEEAAAFEATGEAGDTEPPADAASAQDQIPQVFVRTTPAELIQTDGEPTYSPISGADLLYMSNTETDVFLTIGTQEFYVLLSGRWYTSKDMTGTWTYVPSGELPEAFAAIPPDSERGHVLANVVGTQEAREAVLDAQIPQTATVDRNEATCTVEYDGEPQFEAIEKTDMEYAINTASSVIRIGGSYYCCEDAVWFAASDPLGPWSVCVSVPSEVQTIPPSCPIYNVKYVYVYDYTPSVVYVGYTPGYAGCYVYGGTIVYGTGYIYRGWYGPVYYYPRPVTYGFSMRYSPYYGWGCGFHAGVSGPHGWFHMSWRSGGWHHPPGHRRVSASSRRLVGSRRVSAHAHQCQYQRQSEYLRRSQGGRAGYPNAAGYPPDSGRRCCPAAAAAPRRHAASLESSQQRYRRSQRKRPSQDGSGLADARPRQLVIRSQLPAVVGTGNHGSKPGLEPPAGGPRPRRPAQQQLSAFAATTQSAAAAAPAAAERQSWRWRTKALVIRRPGGHSTCLGRQM